MKRIAAIDFGLKRIGIAISDENGRIAFPLTVVEGGKKAVQNICSALKDKRLSKIVIGLPRLLSGEEGQMANVVRRFGEELGVAMSLPIEWIDERLSSKMADRSLMEAGLKRKNRSEVLDAAAASLMLQTFLDRP